jgi:hypothetical protein
MYDMVSSFKLDDDSLFSCVGTSGRCELLCGPRVRACVCPVVCVCVCVCGRHTVAQA